jgi:hypothetical protein
MRRMTSGNKDRHSALGFKKNKNTFWNCLVFLDCYTWSFTLEEDRDEFRNRIISESLCNTSIVILFCCPFPSMHASNQKNTKFVLTSPEKQRLRLFSKYLEIIWV